MKLRGILIGVALGTCGAGGLATTGPAAASAPQHITVVEQVHEHWGSCGPGDELVADRTVTQAVTFFSSGRATLHLRAIGSVTRTGTGVVASYAEKQRDFEFADGTAKTVGLLSQLVVPGGPGFTVAGHARIGPDGTLVSVTPGLNELFELEESFVPIVCDRLA